MYKKNNANQKSISLLILQANIAAELEAEKKILHTKRQALEMASEEISKANQIIVKQSQELLNLKKTIAWRTEVALQQEKAVQAKESLLSLRENELREARITIEKLREEIPQQLQSMRNFAQGLEQKYSKRKLRPQSLSLPTYNLLFFRNPHSKRTACNTHGQRKSAIVLLIVSAFFRFLYQFSKVSCIIQL